MHSDRQEFAVSVRRAPDSNIGELDRASAFTSMIRLFAFESIGRAWTCARNVRTRLTPATPFSDETQSLARRLICRPEPTARFCKGGISVEQLRRLSRTKIASVVDTIPIVSGAENRWKRQTRKTTCRPNNQRLLHASSFALTRLSKPSTRMRSFAVEFLRIGRRLSIKH
jgi:hypothetical protein